MNKINKENYIIMTYSGKATVLHKKLKIEILTSLESARLTLDISNDAIYIALVAASVLAP